MLVLIVIFLITSAVLLYQTQTQTKKEEVSDSKQIEGFQEQPKDCFLARSVYLLKNSDLRSYQDIDPWKHYIQFGKRENRQWPSCSLATPIINFCPTFAPQIQTARGYTDCCQGEMIDGRCSGKTFCTISPTHDNIPTCDVAWKNYFSEKAERQCPSTMPYYFEDVRTIGSVKGCSASATTQDGKSPSNPGARRCRIYPTERENREKADSCYIERESLLLKCPLYKNVRGKGQIQKSGNRFEYYFCQFNIPGQVVERCVDDKTATQYLKLYNPNWEQRSDAQEKRDNFCSNFVEAQKRREEARRKAEEERKKREAAEKAAAEQRARAAKAEQDRKNALDRLKRAQEEHARKVRELQEKLRRCRI